MLTWLEVAQGVVCLCLLVTCGCHAGSDGRASSERGSEGSARHVPRVDWSVEFTGPGLNKPAIFTFEQLARMEMTRLDNVVMLKTHGPDETTGWRGPSLDVLLTETQVKPGPMTVIVEAADGYTREYSRANLRSAILALQDGRGQWLAELDRACPMRLVPPDKPGDYWIMNPARITVEPPAGDGPS